VAQADPFYVEVRLLSPPRYPPNISVDDVVPHAYLEYLESPVVRFVVVAYVLLEYLEQ